MTSPVYVYYELNNYYQNHRRFVNSWSPRSLRADDITDVSMYVYMYVHTVVHSHTMFVNVTSIQYLFFCLSQTSTHSSIHLSLPIHHPSSILSSIRPFIYPFVHPLNHSPILLFTHLFIIHSFIPLFIYLSTIHSFIHSFVHIIHVHVQYLTLLRLHTCTIMGATL